jgi:hypothetical protein
MTAAPRRIACTTLATMAQSSAFIAMRHASGGSLFELTEDDAKRLPVLARLTEDVATADRKTVVIPDGVPVDYVRYAAEYAQTPIQDYVLPPGDQTAVARQALRYFGVPESTVSGVQSVQELKENLAQVWAENAALVVSPPCPPRFIHDPSVLETDAWRDGLGYTMGSMGSDGDGFVVTDHSLKLRHLLTHTNGWRTWAKKLVGDSQYAG